MTCTIARYPVRLIDVVCLGCGSRHVTSTGHERRSSLPALPEAAIFADALDGLAAGLFLVNEAGRIVHANASGRAMLDERCVLRDAEGRLVACEPRGSVALKAVLADASGADAAPMSVPLSARDGKHYVAHVLPLASSARCRAGASDAGYAAVAALFVHKAAIEAPSAPEIIAKLYNLTPSELRVLLAIVDVGGVPETAQVLGVAEATVKTHLHRVFGKTGATRQAELVKLVAGFSSPIVDRTKLPPRPSISVNRSMDAVPSGDRHPSPVEQ